MYNNFLDVKSEYSDSKYVIIPAPLEHTVSYGKGTSKAPELILESSIQLETYDDELCIEPINAGIHVAEPVELEGNKIEVYLNQLSKKVSTCISDNKIPIVIGGEHSLSYGVFEGIRNQGPKIR